MSSLLDSSGAAIRDLDGAAIKGFRFAKFARLLAALSGRPATFGLALFAVLSSWSS
jgi:hypothetical protein